MASKAFVVAALLSIAATARAGPFPHERDPGGCRLEVLASVPGENHTLFRGVSPDGRRLAVGWDRERGGTTERGAYLLDLRTGARRELAGLNNAASFSPDGKHLVAANYPVVRGFRTEIVELELNGGATRSLAPNEALEWLPSYSPDGNWVVFNSFRSGGSDLYRVDRRNGGLERLTDDPRYEAHAQYSRDGRRIIFHRQIEGDDYGLAILDLKTRIVRALPGTGGEEAYPAWSPDGRWIAYGGNQGQQNGKTDIFLMRADGSGSKRLTLHPDKDAYATFSPDGRFLYFMRQSDTRVAVFRLEIRGNDCRRGR